jgi:hypothetical protein
LEPAYVFRRPFTSMAAAGGEASVMGGGPAVGDGRR